MHARQRQLLVLLEVVGEIVVNRDFPMATAPLFL